MRDQVVVPNLQKLKQQLHRLNRPQNLFGYLLVSNDVVCHGALSRLLLYILGGPTQAGVRFATFTKINVEAQLNAKRLSP